MLPSLLHYLAQTLNAFCNVVTYVVLLKVKYTPVFKFAMLLQCLKQYFFLYFCI